MSTPILKFSGKKINLHSNYIGLGRCPLSIVWIYDRWTGDEIQVVRQACYGYPIKKDADETWHYLPHIQLSEFKPFIQIRFGNPHTIGELIDLEA